jgi:hypothetical protein
MKGIDCGLMYYPGNCLEGLRKTTDTSVRLVGVQTRFDPGSSQIQVISVIVEPDILGVHMLRQA